MRTKIATLILLLFFSVTPYLPTAVTPVVAQAKEDAGLDYYMDGYLIHGEIGDLSEYHELLTALLIAKKGDEIALYIDSPGGQMYTGYAINMAMHKSKARIWVYCLNCISAAGYIAAGGTDMILTPESIVLVHLASRGDLVKITTGDIFKLSSGFARGVLESIHLPESEIAPLMIDVDNAMDVWLSGSHICLTSTRAIQHPIGCYISMR
jgi:ATP-dependent protease ClpP protease subunit